jgi:hypothetical protein
LKEHLVLFNLNIELMEGDDHAEVHAKGQIEEDGGPDVTRNPGEDPAKVQIEGDDYDEALRLTWTDLDDNEVQPGGAQGPRY